MLITQKSRMHGITERGFFMNGNLTTTEKYALAVLAAKGRLSALQNKDRAILLAASCIWDMLRAGCVSADKKGRLHVCAPLPEAIAYCGPVYERLAKKPAKPEKAAYNCIWTSGRIKAMVKSLADDLIERSLLVAERQDSLPKAKLCHVDAAVLAEELAAWKQPERAAAPEHIDLAVLLLESGTAKKLLEKREYTALKKALKQTDSDFRAYVRGVKRLLSGVRTMLWTSAGISAS